MNVLHVIPSVDPASGGPIEGIKQFSRVATEYGHAIEIASLDDPRAPYLKDVPLRTHPLGPSYAGPYSWSRRFVPWIRRNAQRYDVVVVNGIWAWHSFGVWRALRKSRTPYVVFTHGMLDPWFKREYPLKHIKKWLYWPWADYRVLRDAEAVLFTCEEEKVLARESFWLYRCKEVTVSYGTSLPAGDAEDQLRAFYRRFPELNGRRLALFVGRIHPKKGCDLAIEAFAQVLKQEPEWHLVIAGPDQVGWKAQLTEMSKRLGIDSRINWTGMLSGDAKWGAFRASEVLLLPSHQENFGIVVAEAAACGLPALISNKVNIWREVQNDGAGLVANDDSDGACELLRRWVALSQTDQDRMRSSARRCFINRFEMQSATRAFYTVLRDVAFDPRSHGCCAAGQSIETA